MIQINISIPSKDEVSKLSDEEFHKLWDNIISSLPVITEAELAVLINDAELAALINKEEEE